MVGIPGMPVHWDGPSKPRCLPSRQTTKLSAFLPWELASLLWVEPSFPGPGSHGPVRPVLRLC